MSAILACVVYMSATLACVVRFFYLNSSWPQVTGVASTRNRFRMIMCVHSWRGSVESWFYKKLWSNNFRHMSLSLACVVQRWLFNEGDGSSTSSPAVTKVDGLPPASSFHDFCSVENYVLEIQQFVRALVFFLIIYDLSATRHLDISSIG